MDTQFDLAQKSSPAAPPCQPDCCARCAVRDDAICAGLDAPDRAALSRIGRRVTLHPGQTVMWEGDGSTLVANVIEGTLKLSTTTGGGQEQIVGVACPADFVGRPFGAHMPHSVTALTDARLCLYPRDAFDGFARNHAPLEHRLLQRTLDDLDRTRAWILLLGRKNARAKVATFLLDMHGRLPADAAGVIQLPLSRQQIADMIGLTIETVSRQLSGMKRLGVIALAGRRGVKVRDAGKLARMAEDE